MTKQPSSVFSKRAPLLPPEAFQAWDQARDWMKERCEGRLSSLRAWNCMAQGMVTWKEAGGDACMDAAAEAAETEEEEEEDDEEEDEEEEDEEEEEEEDEEVEEVGVGPATPLSANDT
jgi:hypothetical protein